MEWEHVFFESTALIGLQLILLHWNSTSFMESSCYLVDFHLYTVCVPFLFQSTFITCFIKLPTFMPETAVSCAWLKIQISSKHVFFFLLRFSWTVFGAELAAPLGRWWRRAFFVSAGVFSEIPRDVPANHDPLGTSFKLWCSWETTGTSLGNFPEKIRANLLCEGASNDAYTST